MYVGELVEVLRGRKVSEMVPGGFGSNFQRNFTNHSAISKSRTHSPLSVSAFNHR